MSHHFLFLKHIPLFSIPSSIHDLTRSHLICINPYYEDSNNLSSQVPSTLDTPSHVLHHFPLHHTQHVVTNSFIGTGILLYGTPEAPLSPLVPQAPFEIVYPPLRRSTRVCKSTKSPYFSYSCYYSYFT